MDEMCKERPYNGTEVYYFSFKNESYPGDTAIWKKLDYVDCIKVMAYVVIIVGGLLGNISIILTVALKKSMRKTINFYVANLAVADTMICLICMMPQMLVAMVKEDVYILGEFMCKLSYFMQMICLTSSVLTLSAISCNRFRAVMFPFVVRSTKHRTSLVITIIWIASIAVSIPIFLLRKQIVIEWQNFIEPKCAEVWPLEFHYEDSTGKCISDNRLRPLYYVVNTIALFFLPVSIMITVNSLILWSLATENIPGEQHEANANIHSRSRKKVGKMVLFVLLAFIICWTPLQAVILYGAFGHDTGADGPVPYWFYNFEWYAYYIAHANSFINPFIYRAYNNTFMEGFYIVLRYLFKGDIRGRLGRSRMTITTGVTSSRSRTYSLVPVNNRQQITRTSS